MTPPRFLTISAGRSLSRETVLAWPASALSLASENLAEMPFIRRSRWIPRYKNEGTGQLAAGPGRSKRIQPDGNDHRADNFCDHVRRGFRIAGAFAETLPERFASLKFVSRSPARAGPD